MGVLAFRMGGERDAYRVLLHRPRDGNAARGFAHRQNFALRQHALDFGRRLLRRTIEDVVQGVQLRKAHFQFIEKPVKLRLGQRIGSFQLDRILCGQHAHWLLQRMGRRADGDAVFLHGLEQRRLCFRRGAVDLVGQDQIGEHGAGLKLQHLLTALAFAQHVAADNVARHQVRRELYARKFQMQHVGQGLDQFCFAGAGNAFDEAVATRQQAGNHAFNDIFVADDHAPYLGVHTTELLLEIVDLPLGAGVVHGSFRLRFKKYSLTAPRYASGMRSPLTPLSLTKRVCCGAFS